MQSPIKLIVGLGNPGPDYADTRHNVGAWLVELLAAQHHQKLHLETKFKGHVARLNFDGQDCWLLIPTTFMNRSGQAVRALANFYKIAPQEILVAHDELDFAPGVVRLKQSGGAGGHNGLRDIITQLQTPDFFRLRIGIGHPGQRDQVSDYVLSAPSRHDRQQITNVIEQALLTIPDLVAGHMQKSMQQLHTTD